jgi:hypothetical protein
VNPLDSDHISEDVEDAEDGSAGTAAMMRGQVARVSKRRREYEQGRQQEGSR